MGKGKKAGAGGRLLTLLLAIVVVALVLSSVVGRWRPQLPRVLQASHPQVVRVEVLNGSGEGGIASRAASFLRDGGFQVVDIKNADRQDYFATFVVARRHDLSGARAVARYLGDAPIVQQAWGPELADVSLVIGSDRSRLRLGN